ncbi:hypothetical protein [Yoonia sp. R2-816]|uniref:hypothetical protein n=1 Tax=Yoonia sp. R2-816 TaxID=3342638 RepID=UPI00372CCA4B
MAETLPETLGDAVFVTHDGLTAEGGGLLSSIADYVGIVEFRDMHGSIDHLPPEGELAFFGRVIRANGQEVMLLGAVTRASDAMGRPGFLGVCFAVETAAYDHSHIEAIIPFLKAARSHHETEFRHKRHSEFIGLIQPESGASYKLDLVMRDQESKVYVRGAEPSEHEAVLRLWELVETCRRPTILWNTRSGPYPVLTDEITKQESLTAVRVRELSERQKREAAHLEQRHRDQIGMGGSQDADVVNHSTDRQLRFERRSMLLRFPRPDGIDVEFEDYLIGLIQFVHDQTEDVRPEYSKTPAKLFSTKRSVTPGFSKRGRIGVSSFTRFIANHSYAAPVVIIALLLAMILALTIGLRTARDATDATPIPSVEAKPIQEQFEILPD